MSETIVVAGATGYIGRHAVKALDAQGHRVRALVRSRKRAEEPGSFNAPSLEGHVAEWAEVDYFTPSTLMDVCKGANRVVSALGVTRQNASPWDIDFLGNLRVLKDAERHELQSFMFVNVLHSRRGTSLTVRSKSAFAETLSRSRVAGQIINPSGFFSDITDFLRMAQKGFGFTVGDGSARINPIHGADLADFIVDHLHDPAGSWDIGGPDTLSYRELEELTFSIVERKPRIIRVHPGALRPLQWVADRSSPRVSNLARFFFESLQTDAVGTATGTRRLKDYLESVAEES